MNIAAPAHVMPVSSQIVQAGELVANPNPDRLFIDAHFGTELQDEIDNFREAHIHGAVYAQIREVFAGPETATSGSLPLPDIARLQQQIDEWQVGIDTEIIVYGPSPALAARGWWVLKWAGLNNVRVLDGGLRGWELAGGAVAQGDAPPRPGYRSTPAILSAGGLPLIGIDAVEQLGTETIIIDARDETAYLSGCIPGARNLPASDLWTPSRLMRSSSEITELFEQAGVTPGCEVVVYCGGGVLSALVFMALETAGVQPRLFVGSWSQWSRFDERMASSSPYLRELVENRKRQANGRLQA